MNFPMRLIHVNNALIKTADEIILYKQVFISLYLKKKKKNWKWIVARYACLHFLA